MAESRISALWYVLIEEIVDGVALLQRWPWPFADQLGRLVWASEAEVAEALVLLRVLRHELYIPTGLQRDPRVGDVFAVEPMANSRAWRTQRPVTHVRSLFVAGYDVSADAREAARLAFFGSVAAVLPETAVAEEEHGFLADHAQSTLALSPVRLRVAQTGSHAGGDAG